MKYLLDTNICIYLIRKRPLHVLQRFSTYSVGEIAISSITVAELQFGVQKSQYPAQNQRALEQFLIPLSIVDFDHEAAVAYGGIPGRSGESRYAYWPIRHAHSRTCFEFESDFGDQQHQGVFPSTPSQSC